MFKLKIFSLIFFLIFTKIDFNLCSDMDPEMKQMIQDHCPEFWHYIESCQNYANTLDDRQKKLKEGSIYQAMGKLEKSKAEYENFQKQADDCKNKSVSKCKDLAVKTYAALTQTNDYYAQIMSIMHSKDASFPAPIKKTEIVDKDISFTILTNFDEQLPDKVVNFVAYHDDVSAQMADNLTNLMEKIVTVNKEYIDNNTILQKCLSNASSECSKYITSTYNAFNQMNLAIATAMSGLHQKFPQLIPEPQKETKMIDNNLVTKITNFDSDKFTKALTAYKELMIPDYLIKQLQLCEKNMDSIKAKCQSHLKDFYGREVPIQLAGVGVNFAVTMGGMYAIEAAFATLGVPGILVSSVLIGITFIPAVSEALDQFADWIARGILGKKEDTAYYKQFLLVFEEPIKKETIERIRKITKEKIEKAKKIAQEKVAKADSSKKDSISKETIGGTKSTIKKDSI